MHRFHELIAWVRMKARLRTLGNKIETARCEREEALLVVLRGTNNCNGLKLMSSYINYTQSISIFSHLGHHDLITSLRV